MRHTRIFGAASRHMRVFIMPYRLLLQKLEMQKRNSKDREEREQLEVVIVVLSSLIEIMGKLDDVVSKIVEQNVKE